MTIKSNKAFSLIGLATRAGKTVSGEFSTEKSVKSGKGFLVLAAEDASENTRKKFQNMCDYYEVPFFVYGTKEELAAAGAAHFADSVEALRPYLFIDEN